MVIQYISIYFNIFQLVIDGLIDWLWLIYWLNIIDGDVSSNGDWAVRGDHDPWPPSPVVPCNRLHSVAPEKTALRWDVLRHDLVLGKLAKVVAKLCPCEEGLREIIIFLI